MRVVGPPHGRPTQEPADERASSFLDPSAGRV